MIEGTVSNNQLKTLQGELSKVILTFSSINDTLKGLEHTVQKHSSVITDLGALVSVEQTVFLTIRAFSHAHSFIV